MLLSAAQDVAERDDLETAVAQHGQGFRLRMGDGDGRLEPAVIHVAAGTPVAIETDTARSDQDEIGQAGADQVGQLRLRVEEFRRNRRIGNEAVPLLRWIDTEE